MTLRPGNSSAQAANVDRRMSAMASTVGSGTEIVTSARDQLAASTRSGKFVVTTVTTLGLTSFSKSRAVRTASVVLWASTGFASRLTLPLCTASDSTSSTTSTVNFLGETGNNLGEDPMNFSLSPPVLAAHRLMGCELDHSNRRSTDVGQRRAEVSSKRGFACAGRSLNHGQPIHGRRSPVERGRPQGLRLPKPRADPSDGPARSGSSTAAWRSPASSFRTMPVFSTQSSLPRIHHHGITSTYYYDNVLSARAVVMSKSPPSRTFASGSLRSAGALGGPKQKWRTRWALLSRASPASNVRTTFVCQHCASTQRRWGGDSA